MKNEFVADGPQRFLRSKNSKVWTAIKKQRVEELAKATRITKLKIKVRMLNDYFQHGKTDGHKPSPGALW